MKFTRRILFRGSVAIALFCAVGVFAQPPASIHLNEDSFAFARQLIKEGCVSADGKGAWSKDRPLAGQENEFIRVHSYTEYAKWHLGIDERYAENTKARYKFPYGDFKTVHRCGLIAARSRATQYKYHDIENAAARLLQMIWQGKK